MPLHIAVFSKCFWVRDIHQPVSGVIVKGCAVERPYARPYAGIAQMVEWRTRKAQVPGSSPGSSSIRRAILRDTLEDWSNKVKQSPQYVFRYPEHNRHRAEVLRVCAPIWHEGETVKTRRGNLRKREKPYINKHGNYAGVAQLVERKFCTLDVAGSTPVTSSMPLMWLASYVGARKRCLLSVVLYAYAAKHNR